MLETRELATVRAALAYWRDELCPHGTEAMRAYFEPPNAVPLTAAEIQSLRENLLQCAVCYVLFDERWQQLVSSALYGTLEEALQHQAAGQHVAAVLLPQR